MAKDRQVASLKYVLFGSKELSGLSLRIFATLIDESKGLTRPVQIKLQANMQGYDRKELKRLYTDFSIATSSLATTHLNELLLMTGTSLRFSYSENDIGCRCGLWSKKGKKEPRVIEVSRSMLEKIDLSKPGLYPSLEEQKFKRTG